MPPITGGHKYRDLVLQVGDFDARLTTSFCKKIIVVKSKEVKTRCNLAESSKEGFGSKEADLPVMMNVQVSGRGLF
jgi:hypothetical protein